jgi:general secretion pathway protein N
MIGWSRRKILLFAAATLAFLFALFPLRLAADWLSLGDRGLAAREASGSLWSGRLEDARFAGTALGDLRTRLSPLPLLALRARIAFQRRGGDDGAVLTLTRNGFDLADANARLAAGPLFAPLPVAAIDLVDVSARFNRGRCLFAEGRVSARLGGGVAGVSLPGGLAGNARCDRGALLLPLVGQSGMERLDLRFFDGDRYRADFTVRTTDPATGKRLVDAGFERGPRGYLLSMVGVL